MKCPHCDEPISPTYMKKYDELLALISDPDISNLHRIISGALRQAINAHGPITNDWIGSAQKRVYVALRNYLRQIRSDERDRGLHPDTGDPGDRVPGGGASAPERGGV